MEHPDFPSAETLAAFIDGRLDEATRRRITEHIAGCEECWAAYEASTEFADQSTAAPLVTHSRSRWLVPAAAGLGLAAAVAIGLIIVPKFHRDDRAAIMAAAPPLRQFSGRLSGFPYHEQKPTMRGGGDEEPAGSERMYRLQADLLEKKPTVENLHNLGDAHLEIGEFDAAFNTLASALKKQTRQGDLPKAIDQSTDAALLNDFSAAAAAYNQAELAMRAATRAFTLAKSPEAAWNRVVAAQELDDPALLAAARRDYDRMTDAPEWKREYRDRIVIEP